jgi:hypothetical protein
MLASCRDWVQPAAKAHQRASGTQDIPGPVQQPRQRRSAQAPARWATACSTSARSPACSRLSARCWSLRRSMVRRSPTGACQCARALASPRKPRSSRLATSTPSTAPASPDSVSSSCSWQLPGQPPSTHSRSPQRVDSATPWAVWGGAWRPRTPSGWPSPWAAAPGSPGRPPAPPHRRGPSPKASGHAGRGGDAAAVGLAEPQRCQGAEQQVQAVADLGLGDADHPAGTAIRQPIQQHRGDRVQADLQRQRPGAALSGRTGWGQDGRGDRPARPARLRAATNAGRMTRGPDLLAGVSTLPMLWSLAMSGHTEHHGHPH